MNHALQGAPAPQTHATALSACQAIQVRLANLGWMWEERPVGSGTLLLVCDQMYKKVGQIFIEADGGERWEWYRHCLLYTSPSPRD